jgi:hypothetical protein
MLKNEGAKLIAEAIKKMPTLQLLRLDGNVNSL